MLQLLGPTDSPDGYAVWPWLKYFAPGYREVSPPWRFSLMSKLRPGVDSAIRVM